MSSRQDAAAARIDDVPPPFVDILPSAEDRRSSAGRPDVPDLVDSRGSMT
jgi:hypothetical protein